MKRGCGSLGKKIRVNNQPTTPRTETSKAERTVAPTHFFAAVGPRDCSGRVALPSLHRPRPAVESVVMGCLLVLCSDTAIAADWRDPGGLTFLVSPGRRLFPSCVHSFVVIGSRLR